MSNQANQARVIPLRPPAARPGTARPEPARPESGRPESGRPESGRPESGRPESGRPESGRPVSARSASAHPVPGRAPGRRAPAVAREPLWRDLVGDVLRRERLAQERTLKDVADAARISMPYLSEVERGRKEASSEVLAAAAQALGLGIGDLLSLAQGELVRLTGRTAGHGHAHGRGPSASGYDGLCLAA
ncbi:helix-turn-helix domain-containing protein [Streptomyces sp. NPDC020801]|uniref:helix-turn-helix domain-containing protein n=1 Tax=Streptomyces sp. NPDC020801 TaxID=3365093 RepID=UPI0037A6F00B